MKKILIIFTIMMAVTACGEDPTIVARLGRAESAMEEHPDSALAILQSIDVSALRTEKHSAHYALLYSQALDKNYIDITNDSLISIAVDYYSDSDDEQHRMLSYYYHGRVKFNSNDYANSLCSMTKALEYAERLKDSYWYGRIAWEISKIYDNNFHGTEATHYAEIAYEKLKISKTQPFINHSLLHLARVNLNNFEYENSIIISKQLIDSAKVYQDSLLNALSLRILAKSYIGIEDYAKCIESIETIAKTTTLSPDLRCLLGLSHLALKNESKANSILNSITDDYISPDYPLMYEIAKKDGDNDRALFALEKVFYDVDSVFRHSMNQNLSQALSNFYYHESQAKNAELKSIQTSRLIISLTSLLLIISISIIIFIIYRRQQRKIDQNITLAHDIKGALLLRDAQYAEAQKAIADLFSSRFNFIDKLCKTYYESQPSDKAKKKVSDEIKNLIEEFSSNKDKIEELEILANKYCSNVIKSFRTDLPNLKQADYLLFLYSVLGFSNIAISLFLKEEQIMAVYNRKARLKNKISLLEIKKKELYMQFLY